MKYLTAISAIFGIITSLILIHDLMKKTNDSKLLKN